MTLFSSAGQTYFIALFAGSLRAEFALSHGQFGGIYMVATLASAVTLVWLGKLADQWRIVHLAHGVGVDGPAAAQPCAPAGVLEFCHRPTAAHTPVWQPSVIAIAFPVLSLTTVVTGLAAGWLVRRPAIS